MAQNLETLMKGHGFTLADTVMPKRLIVSVNAHRGKGKTHFGLTAPAPIAVFNLDIGLSGVVQKFAAEKQIVVRNFHVPPTQDEAKTEWQKFYNSWMAALENPQIRSILIDTETELWELFRMARFGQLAQIMPYQYAPVNAEYARTMREILKYEKNLILARHMRSVYINDKRTKDYEPAGFNGIEKIVEVVGETWRSDADENGNPPQWQLTISKCRLNPNLDGQTLHGPMATFPWLASTALGDGNVDNWS